MADLQQKYDHLVNRVAALLTAQHHYFAEKEKGYNKQDLLIKSKAIEAELKKLVKEEYAARAQRDKIQKELFT